MGIYLASQQWQERKFEAYGVFSFTENNKATQQSRKYIKHMIFPFIFISFSIFHYDSAKRLALKISEMSKNLIIGFFITGQSVE